MAWSPDYGFLEDFWRAVIEQRTDRRWLIATLFDGDFWLRDPLAWARAREQLQHRGDVSWRYVPAYGSEKSDDFPSCDVLFIGRLRTYFDSALSRHAWDLDHQHQAQFNTGPRGALGNSLSYPGSGQTFTRQDLEASPPEYRRCKLDYAILQIATLESAGEERRMVSIAGLSALGTMGLAMVLTDRDRRAAFVEQVRTLVPWTSGLEPERYLECCVRIEVPTELELRNFLNDPIFEFVVEVAYVAGATLGIRSREIELALRPRLLPAGSGVVSTRDSEEITLPPKRFQLLRRLVEHPDQTSTEELCDALEQTDAETPTAERELVAQRIMKRVHDLNEVLRAMPAFGGRRPVRALKRGGERYRYVLEARGVIRGDR